MLSNRFEMQFEAIKSAMLIYSAAQEAPEKQLWPVCWLNL